MANDRDQKQTPATAKDERQKRLAAALRDNLRRRKGRQRDRTDEATDLDDGANAPREDGN